MMTWILIADSILEEAESDEDLARAFTVKALALRCGVCRTTLWRNRHIRERVRMLIIGRAKPDIKEGVSRRQTKSERDLAKLQRLVDTRTRDYEELVAVFLRAYSNLEAMGVDPNDIFGPNVPSRRRVRGS